MSCLCKSSVLLKPLVLLTSGGSSSHTFIAIHKQYTFIPSKRPATFGCKRDSEEVSSGKIDPNLMGNYTGLRAGTTGTWFRELVK